MYHYWPDLEIREPQVTRQLKPLCEGDGPFRNNVAAMVLKRSKSGVVRILLGERGDAQGSWQWPQGGLKRDELPEDAMRRELFEEVAVKRPKILYRFPFILRYRFPHPLSSRFQPRIGQDQLYFVVALDGEKPNLERAEAKEFRSLRWVPFQEALNTAIWFKEPVYREALHHVGARLQWILGPES